VLQGGVLVTTDLTEAVADEAVERGCGLVVAYHPPIFREVRRLTDETREGRAVLRVVEAGGSVYSPHTALDAADGGVADWLLNVCVGGREREGTRRAMVGHTQGGGAYKVVVFVPTEHVNGVVDAMSGAGAGVIGGYTRCAFAVTGEGTFVGGEGTNPVIGERGVVERVHEERVEMVCGRGELGGVIAALRGAHPYEEPAFDVYRVEGAFDGRVGAGRVCELAETVGVDELAEGARDGLGVEGVRVGGAGDAEVTRVAVCPGAGMGVLRESGLLRSGGGVLFVTGEMGHHDVLEARAGGVSVLLAGHTRTERGYMPVLASRLREVLGDGAEVVVSERDGWPLRVV